MLQFPHYPLPVGDLHITPEDKRLYDTWFDQLLPQDGRLTEDEVLGALQNRGFEQADLYLDYSYNTLTPPGVSPLSPDGKFDRIGFSIFSHLTVRGHFYGDEILFQVVISSPYPLDNNTFHCSCPLSCPLNCLERTCPSSREETS